MKDAADPATPVAYIDESKKPQRDAATGAPVDGLRYAAASAVLMRGDAQGLRVALTGLASSLGVERLHYADLPAARKALVAVELASLPDWDALATVTDRAAPIRRDSTVRRAVLSSQLPALHERYGVRTAVLETRIRSSDAFRRLDLEDVHLVESLRQSGRLPDHFRIAHAGKAEPLLWLADFLASSCTDFVCRANPTPWLILTHRVELDHVPLRAPNSGPENAEAPGH